MPTLYIDEVRIDSRFCGPPTSANGGYVSGLLAQHLSGAVEVTLRRPPPLARELEVKVEGTSAVLLDGDLRIAEAREALLDLEVPDPVSIEDAAGGRSRFPWKDRHLYPTCFVCGTERVPGDGLCIYPGPVEGRSLVAATWTPDRSLGEEERVAPEIVWSVLDCPSYFGFAALHGADEPVLLGRFHAGLTRSVDFDVPFVVIGWFIAREGRKIFTGSALFDASGTLVGKARATWIVLAAT